jgi:hypothetical protein
LSELVTQAFPVPADFPVRVSTNLKKQQISNLSRIVILSLLGCLLIPRGVELQLGTIMIDTSRILLTIFSLVAISQLASGAVVLRLTLADILMFLHVSIIAFSAIYHGQTDEGLETTAAVLIDMGLAYFSARVFISNIACYRYYVRIILLIAAISGGFGLIETVSGFSPINAAYHTFFPKVINVHIGEQRLGLYRATSTFRVNILLGLYCAIAFAMAAYMKPHNLRMGKLTYKLCMALSAGGVFASLSSGPWMAFGLCLFCLVYDRITGNTRGKWKILLLACAVGFAILQVGTNRGAIKLIIDSFTLDADNGYVRMAMWDCVWALMRDYWPLGWGWSNDWPRAVDWYIWASIDSYYAVYLVRSGIFAVLAIMGFLFYCWHKLSGAVGRRYNFADETKGWIIATVCLFITALTVDVFGNLIFATYFLLGAGQALLAERNLALHRNRLMHAGNASLNH